MCTTQRRTRQAKKNSLALLRTMRAVRYFIPFLNGSQLYSSTSSPKIEHLCAEEPFAFIVKLLGLTTQRNKETLKAVNVVAAMILVAIV